MYEAEDAAVQNRIMFCETQMPDTMEEDENSVITAEDLAKSNLVSICGILFRKCDHKSSNYR